MKTSIIGKRFWNLTVLSFSHIVKTKSYFLCVCDCGVQKAVGRSSLIRGDIKSCGCMRSIRISQAKTTHGHTLRGNISKEFISWEAMRRRCYLKTAPEYSNYGGRGITVCEQWMDDFAQFFKDMGARPKGHSLDRINNNLGYYPENCRWATLKEQGNNKRNNRPITYKGKTQNITQWADELGMEPQTLFRRLGKHKWSVDKSLETPVKFRTPKSKQQ